MSLFTPIPHVCPTLQLDKIGTTYLKDDKSEDVKKGHKTFVRALFRKYNKKKGWQVSGPRRLYRFHSLPV
jgi:hypothetical protein